MIRKNIKLMAMLVTVFVGGSFFTIKANALTNTKSNIVATTQTINSIAKSVTVIRDYPMGIFNYIQQNTNEDKNFDFHYAFVDKQGNLRRFSDISSTQLIYNQIYSNARQTNSKITQTYELGIFPYSQQTIDDSIFNVHYAFVDKQGNLRKFSDMSFAKLIYDQIYPSNAPQTATIIVVNTYPSTVSNSYPAGIFNYTPTSDRDKIFDFHYAFVDKEGDLRKFIDMSSARLIYSQIYGTII